MHIAISTIRKVCAAIVLAAGYFSLVFSQPISPVLVGNNCWMNLDNSDIWNKVGPAHLKIIRIGGISYDQNMPSRDRLKFWVSEIKRIGAEPLVTISRKFSGADAASLVQYFIDQNLRVKYWSIGNEPDWDGNLSNSTVATYVKASASAMKAVDPNIFIFVPDGAWYNESMLTALVGGSDDVTGKDANDRWYVDGISWHDYHFHENNYTRQQVLSAGAVFRDDILKVKNKMDAANSKNQRTGTSALRWGIGEINMTVNNPTEQDANGVGVQSFLNGQIFAEDFGQGMKYGATYITPWSIHESDGSRNGTDLSLFDGVQSVAVPRSSWWHSKLMAENMRGVFAACSSSLPNVRCFGSKDTDQIAIIMLNMENTGNRPYTLRLNNDQITGSDPLKINTNAQIAKEYKDSINNQTTQVLVFTLSGNLKKKITYSVDHANAKQAPDEVIVPVSILSRSTPILRDVPLVVNTGRSVSVNLARVESFSVVMLDMTGRIVCRASGSGRNFSIDTRPFASGPYILCIASDRFTIQRRVIVTR